MDSGLKTVSSLTAKRARHTRARCTDIADAATASHFVGQGNTLALAMIMEYPLGIGFMGVSRISQDCKSRLKRPAWRRVIGQHLKCSKKLALAGDLLALCHVINSWPFPATLLRKALGQPSPLTAARGRLCTYCGICRHALVSVVVASLAAKRAIRQPNMRQPPRPLW